VSDETKTATLEEIVEWFLGLALVPPKKPPKTQRDRAANGNMIIGFNRAQETLRHALTSYGDTNETKALGDVRNEQQQRPMEGPGGMKVWVAAS